MDRQCHSCGGFCKKSGCERENVKPKEWVGLTDEEFKFIASKYSLPTQTGMEYFKDELETKLKEKNT